MVRRRGTGSSRALSLLSSGEPLIALVVAEVCNAGWKSLRRREIVTDVARAFSRLGRARSADPASGDARKLIIRSTIACIWRWRKWRTRQWSLPIGAAVHGTALADRVNLLGRFGER